MIVIICISKSRANRMFVNKFWIQGLFGPYKDLPTGGQEGEISDELPEQSPCQLASDMDIHLGPDLQLQHGIYKWAYLPQ